MKLIELLNKIATGEKIPRQVRYFGVTYTYDGSCYVGDDCELLLNHIEDLARCLDKEVEIIEDKPKHIEELDIVPLDVEYAGLSSTERATRSNVNEIHKKVDELSKALNYLLDKEGK